MTRALLATAGMLGTLGYAMPAGSDRVPKSTLVIGMDVSGSFRRHHADAIEFTAHYLYGHLNGLGELRKPSAVFVGSVGGGSPGEAKSFQPIHACCASCIPRKTSYTDFNAFFDRIATLVKRQGLVLAPLNIVILSDGLPDVTGRHGADGDPYAAIDLAPLEYLSRSVSVRLLYASPTVAVDGSGAFPADVCECGRSTGP